jgi:hypothetical protein
MDVMGNFCLVQMGVNLFQGGTNDKQKKPAFIQAGFS